MAEDRLNQLRRWIGPSLELRAEREQETAGIAEAAEVSFAVLLVERVLHVKLRNHVVRGHLEAVLHQQIDRGVRRHLRG